jgi:hypothetical protein
MFRCAGSLPKKDFRSLLPLSYLSQRERRLRKEASFMQGAEANITALPESYFFRTLLGLLAAFGASSVKLQPMPGQ